MAYRVKEIFYTLQGEAHRPGVRRCSAAFRVQPLVGPPRGSGHGEMPVLRHGFRRRGCRGFARPRNWRKPSPPPFLCSIPKPTAAQAYIVFTGGEPALQLTRELIDRLHALGFELGVESNGTLPLPEGLDWITVSPKVPTRWPRLPATS